MALDDLVPEEAKSKSDNPYPVGDVKSRMKPKNIEMGRKWWQSIAVHNPAYLSMFTRNCSKEQLKLFIQLLDNVLEDEIQGMSVSEQEKKAARRERESLVEELESR